MIKKKAKGKTAKKKSSTKKSLKKQLDPAEVRQEIAGMVKLEAKEITAAVIDQATHGELAPAKYLLEMAGVYPPVTDGSMSSSDEDCLAKTLLHRLNLPEEPIKLEEDDEPVTVIIPARSEVAEEIAKDSGELPKAVVADNSSEGVGCSATAEQQSLKPQRAQRDRGGR